MKLHALLIQATLPSLPKLLQLPHFTFAEAKAAEENLKALKGPGGIDAWSRISEKKRNEVLKVAGGVWGEDQEELRETVDVAKAWPKLEILSARFKGEFFSSSPSFSLHAASLLLPRVVTSSSPLPSSLSTLVLLQSSARKPFPLPPSSNASSNFVSPLPASLPPPTEPSLLQPTTTRTATTTTTTRTITVSRRLLRRLRRT